MVPFVQFCQDALGHLLRCEAKVFQQLSPSSMLDKGVRNGETDHGGWPFLLLHKAAYGRAEAAGAHGVIVPKRRSTGLTSIVYKTSAGAVEYLPVCRVGNLADTLRELKERGVWVYGLDMDGQSWTETDLTGATALVVGSEGRGIGRLVRECCDFVVSLPMHGHINSLNASVATGILLYEAARQRHR